MSTFTFREAGQLLAATAVYLYFAVDVTAFADPYAEIMGLGLLVWGLDGLGRLGAYAGMRKFVDRIAKSQDGFTEQTKQ